MKFPLKLSFVLTAIVVLLATTLSGSVYAGSTTKALSTNYTLVNFGADAAVVTASYMKSDGSVWTADTGNTSFTIPGNYGSNQIRQYFDTTMSAGQGSVVVSSSQPLGAVVQIQARNQTPSQGAYSGYTAGSNKFYVPLAAKRKTSASGEANTQIIVQNADSFAFTVNVDLYAGSTKTYTKTSGTLQPGQSFYYDLTDETNLPVGWLGSAVVTGNSSGKVTVVSNFFTGPDAMQTFNAFPQESVGAKWIIPLFFSRLSNGLSTVIAVQNLSGASIPAGGITMSCTRDSTTAPTTISVSNPGTIANNASYSFNPATDTTLFPDSRWGGSCRLDSGSANVVAIVQMRYVGVAGNSGAAAYEAISETAAAGKKLVVPLVAKMLGNGFASVVTIQNMDTSAAASVTLTYTPSSKSGECPLTVCDKNHDGSITTADNIVVGPLSIPASASKQRNHRIATGGDAEPDLPAGWQGSLLVESSTTNINGFVQLTNYKSTVGDTFMAHNAFVRP